jgi:sec-independent protein translocase protein TatA
VGASTSQVQGILANPTTGFQSGLPFDTIRVRSKIESAGFFRFLLATNPHFWIEVNSISTSSTLMIESPSALLIGFMGLGMPELIIVAVIFMVLFGGAKLPGLMRNLGRSVNEFKTGIKEKPADGSIEDDSDQ